MRASAPWRDRLRQYKVVIDGAPMGSVAAGPATGEFVGEGVAERGR